MTTIGPFNNTPAEIWGEVKRAGEAAAKAQEATLGDPNTRFDCGFAWVIIRPARGPFVNYLKSIDVGRTGYESGWHIWYDHFSGPTQSVSVHEKAATAVCLVLQKHGINAGWSSRMD